MNVRHLLTQTRFHSLTLTILIVLNIEGFEYNDIVDPWTDMCFKPFLVRKDDILWAWVKAKTCNYLYSFCSVSSGVCYAYPFSLSKAFWPWILTVLLQHGRVSQFLLMLLNGVPCNLYNELSKLKCQWYHRWRRISIDYRKSSTCSK